MSSAKTYLVTGGAGFIGSNFIRYMLEKHERIFVVNADCLTYAGNLENLKDVEKDPRYVFKKVSICDCDRIRALFDEYEIDYVVNFAAESHVDRSIANPKAFVETNVNGTVNLLHCAKNAWSIGGDSYRQGVKFLQVSTDEVYGSLLIGEPDALFSEKTPLDPHSPYSASKASADFFVKAFWDTYKLPINITRCSNNYGPYQFPEKLIPLMINNCLNHESLPLYGDGMQIRDWLYVRDHCRAIDAVIDRGVAGEIYNVGGHNERANIDIVRAIIGYLRENVDSSIGEHQIRHVSDRKGHDRRYGINPAKIKTDLDWEPETCFEEGIKMTLEWYLDNSEWVQNVVSGDYQKYYRDMYLDRMK